MWKCTTQARALNILSELQSEGHHHLCYGRSIYDNHWYIGTRDELKAIGIIEVNP